jgi:hypothetical protein
MRSQQIAREIEATTQKKKEETVDKDQTKLEVKTTPDPKKNRVKMGL